MPYAAVNGISGPSSSGTITALIVPPGRGSSFTRDAGVLKPSTMNQREKRAGGVKWSNTSAGVPGSTRLRANPVLALVSATSMKVSFQANKHRAILLEVDRHQATDWPIRHLTAAALEPFWKLTSAEGHRLCMIGLDQEDDAVSTQWIGLPDVLLGYPVNDLPGPVFLDTFHDLSAEQRPTRSLSGMEIRRSLAEREARRVPSCRQGQARSGWSGWTALSVFRASGLAGIQSSLVP